jgi:hypothetical protein
MIQLLFSEDAYRFKLRISAEELTVFAASFKLVEILGLHILR